MIETDEQQEAAEKVSPQVAVKLPQASDTDAATIARLAELGELEYERARKPTAKALGCRFSVLDRLVDVAREQARLARAEVKWRALEAERKRQASGQPAWFRVPAGDRQ